MFNENLRRLHSPSTRFSAAFLLLGTGFPFLDATQVPNQVDSAHFAYDASLAFNETQISEKHRDGVAIQEITYTGSNGDTVSAYLVVPKQGGKFAAIVWGHWLMPDAANSNREEFLERRLRSLRVELCPS
jgi:hypothetical protein